MKKLLLFIAVCFFCAATTLAAPRPDGKNGVYMCNALNDATVQSLDSLDILAINAPNRYDLIDKDSAIVFIYEGVFFFIFDADSTEAEYIPEDLTSGETIYIRPNDFATQGQGVWKSIGASGALYLTITGDGTQLTLAIAGCTSGTCSATQLLNGQTIDFGTAVIDFDSSTISFPEAGWFFSNTDGTPSITGQFRWDPTITELSGGALALDNGSEVVYTLLFETMPSANGQVPTYNSTTKKWVPIKPVYTKCTTAVGVTSSSDWPVERFPYAVTITDIYVYQRGATNVIGGLDECTGTNGTCGSVSAVDSDITGTDGNEVQDDGTLSNGGIAAGNRIYWHTTSVSGTNTDLQICFDYTID